MTFTKNILKNLCHKNKRPGIAAKPPPFTATTLIARIHTTFLEFPDERRGGQPPALYRGRCGLECFFGVLHPKPVVSGLPAPDATAAGTEQRPKPVWHPSDSIG